MRVWVRKSTPLQGKEAIMASVNFYLESQWKQIRKMARVLTILWASGWVLFGLSSALSEGMTPSGVLLHTALPGLIFLLTTIITWRWEVIGGKLLMFEGLFILVFFPVIAAGSMPIEGILYVILTMALPPLGAGLMLRASWQRL
jgi:hypothetical protein